MDVITDTQRVQNALNEWSSEIGKLHDTHSKVRELCRRFNSMRETLNDSSADPEVIRPKCAALVAEFHEAEKLFREMSASAASIVVLSRKVAKQVSKFT